MYQPQPKLDEVIRTRVPGELLARIQKLAGERGVSEFFRRAAEAEADRLERLDREKGRLLSRN